MDMHNDANKCLTCAEHKNCKDSFTAWIFFIIGIIATIAIRVVTVLIHVGEIHAKIAWYVGVIGFFFFVYKFRVGQARSKRIQESGLIDKISRNESLSREDYALVSSILLRPRLKKERINYLFIFALSALAIVLAIYMDFLK